MFSFILVYAKINWMVLTLMIVISLSLINWYLKFFSRHVKNISGQLFSPSVKKFDCVAHWEEIPYPKQKDPNTEKKIQKRNPKNKYTQKVILHFFVVYSRKD